LFWEKIYKIRTNAFEYNDEHPQRNQQQQQQHQRRQWAFRSRKSHILDTNGHYAWKRELNCFQGQSLPDAIFPHNTLEITMDMALGDEDGDSNGDGDGESKECLRIRFGALEGLRGWMSLDSEPIPTTHARDNAHWKSVASQDQLPNNSDGESIIASTSYDYAYTTPYKGGTDTIIDIEKNQGNDNDNNYGYLHADSSSFVPKHDAGANDVLPAAGGAGIRRVKVKLRKPICKCKGDGGRAPFVSSKNNDRPQKESSNNDDDDDDSKLLLAPSSSRTTKTETARRKRTRRPCPPPQWTFHLPDPGYRVDIEGMLHRNGRRPFLFREDVDLWQDDLHDNGTAWLKARCFVCNEGWACLLRNFVRVDGVLCRVVDTRYLHTFGTSKIYREHSWREGPWDPLVRAIHRDNNNTTTTTTQSQFGQAINDSIAARYLPLTKPSRTECLSLLEEQLSPTTPAAASVAECGNANRHEHQLVMINDKTIEDAIPVPNSEVEQKLGISFVLKRSKGTVLEAISSSSRTAGDVDGNNVGESLSFPVSSLWSKHYCSSDSDSESNSGSSRITKSQATVLSVRISPDSTDGGRLAIGDDRGRVEVWRLSTGASLWSFPVAPISILTRLEKNPNFQSARLWVDHLAWSGDGSLIGASAGRNTVLASASKDVEMSENESGRILSTLENTAGTVTGLAFRDRVGHPVALAVASYGAICWLTVPSPSKQKKNMDVGGPETLKREGAAVECIDISPDGKKVAVGFLDKTLRVFTMNTECRSIPTATSDGCDAATIATVTTMPSFASRPSKDDSVVDWVGFNAAVKSVRFSPKGKWLAAMGGNTVLVIKNTLSPRIEAPIVCRTPGKTEADGGDGTCHKFEGIKWSNGENNNNATVLLAALNAKTGSVHVFRFSNNDAANHHQDAWPIRALPVLTVSPNFRRPSTFATMQFAFFLNSMASTHKQEGKDVAFLVVDRSTATADNDSQLHQELGTKLHVENSGYFERVTEGSGGTKDEQLSFRRVL
jgi:WD40 repeat protein